MSVEKVKLFIDKFFNLYLDKRDIENCLDMLSENIQFIGTAFFERSCGLEQTKQVFYKSYETDPTSYLLDYEEFVVTPITEDCFSAIADMVITPKNGNLAITRVRFSLTITRRKDSYALAVIHSSIFDDTKASKEFFPKIIGGENLSKIQNELLGQSVTGGILGIYYEDSFPIAFANKKFLDYLGYESLAELKNCCEGSFKQLLDIYSQEYLTESLFYQTANGGEHFLEYCLKKKNGEYIWLRDSGKLINKDSPNLFIISICFDITEQKSYEIELKKLSSELQSITASMPGGVATFEISSQIIITYFNENTAAMLGYTTDEFKKLQGENTLKSVHPEDLPMVIDEFQRAIALNDKFRCVYRKKSKNGSYVWLMLNAIMIDSDDEVSHWYAVFTDMTQEKNKELKIKQAYDELINKNEELRLSDERFKTALELSQIFI